MAGADRLASVLAACLAEDLPANVALMRLLGEAESLDEAEAALSGAGGDERLKAMRDLLSRHPGAFAAVRAVLGAADHGRPGGSPAEAVAHWGAVFDRLAGQDPETSVALYGLGSPELFARATDEVVAWLAGRGLLGPDRDAVEIGCGIGRFVRALAPRCRSVTGLDVSAGMIAEARLRCAALGNVTLLRTDGTDLSSIPDGSADFVLASDVFPYLVSAGGGLAERHVSEAARVLRPGGSLAILNYSYRGDVSRDLSNIAATAGNAGLEPPSDEGRPFGLWDAASFLLRKP